MATVTPPARFDHEETQRRVRHPLQVLRKYIRRYVILEGLALTLLCAAALFWFGVALDFGLFKLDFDLIGIHAIDWVQEFDELDPSMFTSRACRVIILAVCVLALLFLGFSKVVVRWIREFNDRALALVLERRYPRQLGDRLITAIELADPKLAQKYGYSQAMVEKTIQEAVTTLDRLPVASVFNWGRLVRLWLYVAGATVGVWLVAMTVVCLTSLLTASPLTPYGFTWQFADVGTIWTERSVLMMNTYWPRRAYLEVRRFQPSKLDPNDMRIPKDVERERNDIQVRAIEWVIADRNSPQGWRALRWKDLPSIIEPSSMFKESTPYFPENFSFFDMDPEELEPNLAAALFSDDRRIRSSGEIRAHLKDPAIADKIKQRGAEQTIKDWLNWQEWTIDKLAMQRAVIPAHEKRFIVETALGLSNVGALAGPRLPAVTAMYANRAELVQAEIKTLPTDLAPLDALLAKLEELAETPSMSRTLRKLEVPGNVEVTFRGEENTDQKTYPQLPGNKFDISLKELSKESTRYRFRARGENFFTSPKFIVLVSSPAVEKITLDQDVPAYIYHRLHGEDQLPLKGKRHKLRGIAVNPKGDYNAVDVPLGSDLVVRVRLDRALRDGKSVFSLNPPLLDAGFDTFRGEIKTDDDRGGFALHMPKVTRKFDFVVEFFDEDNIRGTRRFRVAAIPDMEPSITNLSINTVRLFGLFPPRDDDNDTPAEPSKKSTKDTKAPPLGELIDAPEIKNAVMITANALIPFDCVVKDEYGLVRVGYHFKRRVVDIELTPQGPRSKAAPPSPKSKDKKDIKAPERVLGFKEAFVHSRGFQSLLRRKSPNMITMDELAEAIAKKGKIEPWEFDFADDRDDFTKEKPGFDVGRLMPELKDVSQLLPELKLTALESSKFGGQLQILLQVQVQASDNNVETGSPYAAGTDSRLLPFAQMATLGVGFDPRAYHWNTHKLIGNFKSNKNGYLSFLVVTENELLNRIKQEETPLERSLTGAKSNLDKSILMVKKQNSEMAPDADMETIFNRLLEVRNDLDSAGNAIRRAHQEYANILAVMEVNRVDEQRVREIRDKIVYRLRKIVVDMGEQRGLLTKAENSFANTHLLVEKDFTNKRSPNVEEHRKNFLDTIRKLEDLNDELKRALDAMRTGIKERELLDALIALEADQRDMTLRFARIWAKRVEDDLNKLINPGK